MSQFDVLNLIRSNPGIRQTELYIHFDLHKRTIADQVGDLVRSKQIHREPDGNTWKLWAVNV